MSTFFPTPTEYGEYSTSVIDYLKFLVTGLGSTAGTLKGMAIGAAEGVATTGAASATAAAAEASAVALAEATAAAGGAADVAAVMEAAAVSGRAAGAAAGAAKTAAAVGKALTICLKIIAIILAFIAGFILGQVIGSILHGLERLGRWVFGSVGSELGMIATPAQTDDVTRDVIKIVWEENLTDENKKSFTFDELQKIYETSDDANASYKFAHSNAQTLMHILQAFANASKKVDTYKEITTVFLPSDFEYQARTHKKLAKTLMTLPKWLSNTNMPSNNVLKFRDRLKDIGAKALPNEERLMIKPIFRGCGLVPADDVDELFAKEMADSLKSIGPIDAAKMTNVVNLIESVGTSSQNLVDYPWTAAFASVTE